MAREKKPDEDSGEVPAWMVTFSDLMTLLLTFFVLLISMAVIDERSRLVVLGSVSGTFGAGVAQFNPLSPENVSRFVEPGAMDLETGDLEPLKDMLWEDSERDLDFQENRYVQILSISSEVLFLPGETKLSAQGIILLQKLLPSLLNLRYPLLVAGHSSLRRDEEGGGYQVDLVGGRLDSTWALSLERSLAVYQFFKAAGIDPAYLAIEAFGQFRPRYANSTPEGRMRNRRVDLVLDKRNQPYVSGLERTAEPPIPKDTFMFRDFRFDLGAASGGR